MRLAAIRDFTELRVYRTAQEAAMRIYDLSRAFPREEAAALTSQIRRSSRSVCANVAEGWQKRRYPAAFRCKLTDAAGEADETRSWIEFAEQCGFLAGKPATELKEQYRKIVAHLIRMLDRPDDWRIR